MQKNIENIKAFFFDLDGTLVSFRNHKISPDDMKALLKLKMKGYKIFISTGRPLKSIIHLLGNVDIFDGIVSVNGAKNIIDKKTVSTYYMDEKDVSYIIELSNKEDLALGIMSENDYVGNKTDDIVRSVHESLDIIYPRTTNLNTIKKNDIFGINAYTDIVFQKAMLEDQMSNSLFKRWHKNFVDINRKNVSKKTGIKDILKNLNLDFSNIVSFGDGANDIEMLKESKIGVAMGNASEEVKEISDFITKTVDESGVEYFLQYFKFI